MEMKRNYKHGNLTEEDAFGRRDFDEAIVPLPVIIVGVICLPIGLIVKLTLGVAARSSLALAFAPSF